jgi:hypothetical protein
MAVIRYPLELIIREGACHCGSFGKIKLASQCMKRYFPLQN